MTQYIQSIQQFEITIATSSTSNTATINAVTTANSFILLQGFTTTETTEMRSACGRAALTNSTTVTATRNTAGASSTVTIRGVVIELTAAALASSVQTGTITMTATSSNTATISAVGSNAFVVWLGFSTTETALSYSNSQPTVVLTNSTTVTANKANSTANTTVGYAVIDIVAGTGFLAQAPQARSLTSTNTVTGLTDTITSVNTNNSIIIYNGALSTSTLMSTFTYTIVLTNGTTVTLTRTGTSGTRRTIKYTVLEFASGILASSVQRSTTAVSANPTDATISSISTTLGVVNKSGTSSGGTFPSLFSTAKLLNATTVRNESDAGTPSNSNSWEAFEFAAPASSLIMNPLVGVFEPVGYIL